MDEHSEPTSGYDITDLFGPVIHAYTRAEALEDGYMHDASELAREVGFLHPLHLTAAAKRARPKGCDPHRTDIRPKWIDVRPK